MHGGTGGLETLKMNLVFVTMEYAVALNFIYLSLIRKYLWFFCSIYYSFALPLNILQLTDIGGNGNYNMVWGTPGIERQLFDQCIHVMTLRCSSVNAD